MMESTGVKEKKEFEDVSATSPVLTEEQTTQLTLIRERIDNALQELQQKRRLFNNLDFFTDDSTSVDIRNSFIRPKLNDDEVRINTGTVEKKMMSIVNELLSLNLQPEVQAFDENDKPIIELGEVLENVLKRTNEQENDDDVKFPILWDLATRRAAFVEEYQEEKTIIDKRKQEYDLENGKIKFETKEYKISRPRKRHLDPRTVIVGDFYLPNYQYNNQPFIVKYDRKHWREAKAIFGKFKNWNLVKKGGRVDNSAWYMGLFEWRAFNTLGEDEVEILHYYSYPDDEYQIIANGVPLLPPATPLPYEYEGYSIQMFVYRQLENIAYSQLFSLNAKVLAGLQDEMLRLIVRKWRQSIEPPTIVKGNKVLSRDIWSAGATANGLSKDDVQKLIDNQGISQSEMLTLDLISKKIEEEMGVAKLFQGATDRNMTATQALEQMRQAIKGIGVLYLAWSKVIKTMSFLRIYNVVENFCHPVSIESKNGDLEKIFKSFTINKTKLEGDETGTMVVNFSDKDLSPIEEEQVYQFEEEQRKQGNNVRYKNINIEKLRNIRMKLYVTTSPQEKNSTALNKIMFTDELNQAAGISKLTGRNINADTVIGNFERVWKRKNMFESAPKPIPNPEEEMKNVTGTTIPPSVAEQAGSNGNEMSDQLEEMMSGAIKRPGVNSNVA